MEQRFEFGRNWKDYIEQHFSPERVEVSRKHMLAFLGRPDLAGVTFMDIGCGSGLHSLAAWKSGASRIISFDYDEKSVEATRMLHEYAGRPGNWVIRRGSVLDEAFMQALPKADLVYSWGVLHHTGDVWKAIRLAAVPLNPGGRFYIALYSADVQKDPPPEFWLRIKQRYLRASRLEKRWLELWYIARFRLGFNPLALPYFLWQWHQYRKNRGMSMMTDVRDWLGGWPMEFCRDADVERFVKDELGMTLINIATGEANSEFLFAR